MKKIYRISVFALFVTLSLSTSLAAMLYGIIVCNELSIVLSLPGFVTLCLVLVIGGGLGSGVALLGARALSRLYDRFFIQ